MKTLKHILSRYTAFLWAILKPLGPWGVLLAAVLDGAAFGLPIDLVVGGYVSGITAMADLRLDGGPLDLRLAAW